MARRTGTARNDSLIGTGAADYINGKAGNDTLKGGGANDRMFGEYGNDAAYGGGGADKLYGGSGLDKLFGESGNDFLYGQHGHDKLYGGSGLDYLDGGENNDYLDGGVGNDRVYGGSGDDTCIGGGGNDLLIGGEGKDHLNGGTGIDIFELSDARHSRPETRTTDLRDIILDFTKGQDKINLTRIDAQSSARGNQDFDFIGAARFSGKQGELRLASDTVDGKAYTVLQGDQNGDGKADFEILLRGRHGNLTADDFRGVIKPVTEEPKPQEPKPQEPKPQEPKPQEPKPEEPKPEEPVNRDDTFYSRDLRAPFRLDGGPGTDTFMFDHLSYPPYTPQPGQEVTKHASATIFLDRQDAAGLFRDLAAPEYSFYFTQFENSVIENIENLVVNWDSSTILSLRVAGSNEANRIEVNVSPLGYRSVELGVHGLDGDDAITVNGLVPWLTIRPGAGNDYVDISRTSGLSTGITDPGGGNDTYILPPSGSRIGITWEGSTGHDIVQNWTNNLERLNFSTNPTSIAASAGKTVFTFSDGGTVTVDSTVVNWGVYVPSAPDLW